MSGPTCEAAILNAEAASLVFELLVDYAKHQRVRANEAEALLGRIEWSKNLQDGKGNRCPICNAAKPPGGPGHAHDCLFWRP